MHLLLGTQVLEHLYGLLREDQCTLEWAAAFPWLTVDPRASVGAHRPAADFAEIASGLSHAHCGADRRRVTWHPIRDPAITFLVGDALDLPYPTTSAAAGHLSVWFGTLPRCSSFEDYWSTFLSGQGKTGSYVTNLRGSKRGELEHHVRAAYLCGMADGPRGLATSFWAMRGEVPSQ